MQKNIATKTNKKLDVFDIVKDLSFDKKDLLHDDNNHELNLDNVKVYCPRVINLAFSQYLDTLLDSQLMNEYSSLWPDLQHDYYFYELRRMKRYSGKWGKKEDRSADKAIADCYDVNLDVAKSFRSAMTAEQVSSIMNMSMGGLSAK